MGQPGRPHLVPIYLILGSSSPSVTSLSCLGRYHGQHLQGAPAAERLGANMPNLWREFTNFDLCLPEHPAQLTGQDRFGPEPGVIIDIHCSFLWFSSSSGSPPPPPRSFWVAKGVFTCAPWAVSNQPSHWRDRGLPSREIGCREACDGMGCSLMEHDSLRTTFSVVLCHSLCPPSTASSCNNSHDNCVVPHQTISENLCLALWWLVALLFL